MASSTFILSDSHRKQVAELINLLKLGDSAAAVKFVIDNSLLENHLSFAANFEELINTFPPVSSETLTTFLTSELLIRNTVFIDIGQRVISLSSYLFGLTFSDSQLEKLCLLIYQHGNDIQKSKILESLKLYSLLSKGLLTSYNTMPPLERGKVLESLITFAIKQKDSLLLQGLVRIEGTETIVPQTLEGQFLLSLKGKDCSKVQHLMSQFTHRLGMIVEDGAYLTLAQIRAHHNPNFNPILISSDREFYEFVEILKEHYRPGTRERFICTGMHWFIGDVKFELNGDVSLVLLDSMGIDNVGDYGATSVLDMFSSAFPNTKIYFSIPKTQARLGCSLFSLDTMLHLYDSEEKYHPSGLHGYVADAAKKMENAACTLLVNDNQEKKTVTINPFMPPLGLLTAMQSRKLFDEIDSRPMSERNIPINKRGDLPTHAYVEAKFFKKASSSAVLQNTRIEKVRRKMGDHNLRFLSELSKEKKSDMSLADCLVEVITPFTVKAFRTKCQHNNLKKKPEIQDPEVIESLRTSLSKML